MKNTAFLTLTALLISVGSLFSQSHFRNGFIITNDQDTISGLVDYRSNLKNYKSCVFKDEKGINEYYPNQIAGYGYVNDKLFTSQVKHETFIEVLVRGDISLYKSKDQYLVKKDTSYFELESVREEVRIDGKLGYKEKTKWKGVLAYLLSDCLENSLRLVSDISLGEKSLTKLIVKYNKCEGLDFEVYKANKPWTKIEFGASIGLARSTISNTTGLSSFPYLDNSYTSIDPLFGILISISSPRLTEKFAFQSEIHFMKSSFSSLVKINERFIEYHDTYINLNTLSVPLSFKYSFPQTKYGFYFQTGINFDYQLNPETRLLSEHIEGNVVTTYPETEAFEISKSQIGYWGGIGIFKSYDKFKGSLSIRYFQMSALDKVEDFTSNNSRVSVNLILFKI